MDTDRPAVAELMASVAAAVSRRATTVSENVYEVTRREIPELGDDQAVLTLFASSIDSNVTTCLQIMQHQIDLADVHAPTAALEEARRRAQRGTPLTALLRAYRLGHTVFLDWVFRELARQARGDARMLTAVTMDLSKIVAGYVDQTSEEIVAAYARERENWLRNRSAAQAARIRDLLSGQLVNVSATEATLGYRLRQHHVGVVCWTGAEAASAENITRLDRAISHIAAQTAAGADPVFLPRDESSAWAWLPLGIRDRFDAAAASTADLDGDLHVAFGDVVKGIAGFRLTHQQALAAQAVALAGGSPPRVVTYGEVAPVAMMLGSAGLLRAWVLHTLGRLATDDEHHDRLRHTLLVFLDTGGSFKATAERLVLHKNTVQYRIRKAEESLGHPVGDNRHDVELALQASRWLGSSVLQPAAGRDLPGPCVEGCCVAFRSIVIAAGRRGVRTCLFAAAWPCHAARRAEGTPCNNHRLLHNVRFCNFTLRGRDGSAGTPQGAAPWLLYRRKSSFAVICQSFTIRRAISTRTSTQPDIRPLCAGPTSLPEVRSEGRSPLRSVGSEAFIVEEESVYFDVLLCHNSADKPAMRLTAERLRERGVRPWLDEDELPPGRSWQVEPEKLIEHINAAAVFVGPSGIGRGRIESCGLPPRIRGAAMPAHPGAVTGRKPGPG